jgi:hypothetical protein
VPVSRTALLHHPPRPRPPRSWRSVVRQAWVDPATRACAAAGSVSVVLPLSTATQTCVRVGTVCAGPAHPPALLHPPARHPMWAPAHHRPRLHSRRPRTVGPVVAESRAPWVCAAAASGTVATRWSTAVPTCVSPGTATAAPPPQPPGPHLARPLPRRQPRPAQLGHRLRRPAPPPVPHEVRLRHLPPAP